MRAGLLVAVALALSGCTLLKDPEIRELAGPTDGYTPTNSFLKLHVQRDDGSTAMLNFERRDWYTAEIARKVDQRQLEFVSAQAMPRDILNEYLARSVHAPEDLDRLRYDSMGATPEQRAQMDAEYERLLEEWLAKVPEPPAPPTPGLVPLEGAPGV